MKPAVENHQCGGGSGVEFYRRLERRVDWDRGYGRRSYTTVWCTDGSKISVSYFSIFQLSTTQLHHHYFPTEYASSSLMLILTVPLCFSIFKVDLFKPRLDALCNTPAVCHQLSNGFEFKHGMLSDDEGVKIKSTRVSSNLNLDHAPLLTFCPF